MNPTRELHQSDAITWLRASPVCPGASFVASLPDLSEFPKLSLTQWKEWFVDTAALVIERCPDDGVAIFYQSDVKHAGTWVDKSYLCQRAAERAGAALLQHQIVCRAPAGTPNFGRPAYSHLLIFSRALRLPYRTRSLPDVIGAGGRATWARGMGLETCLTVAQFIKEETTSHIVVNPFCGEGAMLAAANAVGLAAVGIEKNRARVERARSLRLDVNERRWLKRPLALAKSVVEMANARYGCDDTLPQ